MATQVLTPTGPPTVVGPTTKRATRPTNKLPQFLMDEARKPQKVAFDPKTHLDIAYPGKIYTMKEIGLEGQGISPVAASAPFSLFTQDAVQQMRAEIFSEPVLESCQYADRKSVV